MGSWERGIGERVHDSEGVDQVDIHGLIVWVWVQLTNCGEGSRLIRVMDPVDRLWRRSIIVREGHDSEETGVHNGEGVGQD